MKVVELPDPAAYDHSHHRGLEIVARGRDGARPARCMSILILAFLDLGHDSSYLVFPVIQFAPCL